MMLLHAVLFALGLIVDSIGTPLRQHLTGCSQSILELDRQAALAARAATRRKFENAPALLAGLGTSLGYTVPPSLQKTYDSASDHATNITLLTSLLKLSPGQPRHSPSVIRVAAATSRGNATVDPLQDETDGADDYEYYGPMTFGSQAQSLLIDFDTGSADLWVPVSCSDCGKLSSFQANASGTYQNTNQPFAVGYGLGYVSGTLAQDTVAVGPLRVYNQSFGAVQSVSSNFAYSPNDGLVGMAFGTIASSHEPTFFENLMPQLYAPLFSVYMTRTQARGSEIYLGGIDVSKAGEDSVRWVPVVSKGYWSVAMTAIFVDGTPVQTKGVTAIIDTGTSFMYLPSRIALAVYKLIPDAKLAPDYGDGFYAYPCTAHVTVSFVLGPETFALDPRDFNLGQHAGDPTNSTCVAALVDGGPAVDFAILGDSFLKSFVSVYDYSHDGRVGLVKSINE